jgi:hypothetical protein
MRTTANIQNERKTNNHKTHALHETEWARKFAKIELIYKSIRKHSDYRQQGKLIA